MNETRNPFLLRSSEHIESDATFVRFFGPGAIELLNESELLSTRVFFSAAGGGKTSLMRLFQPGPQLELHRHQTVEGYKELFDRMKSLGIMGDDGPRLLGVRLSCDRGYVNLVDIGLDVARQSRLLFALLDARLILAGLRDVLILKRLRQEEDLVHLQIKPPAEAVALPGLSLPCNGSQLRDWARRREAEICAVLDSFSPGDCKEPGSDRLYALDLLKPNQLLIDGEPVAQKVLIMLDDVQKLTIIQRERLIHFLHDKRSTTPVWIAERLEALSRNELLDPGSVDGRDSHVTFLEHYWRDHPSRYENLVLSVADRRARDSRSIIVSSFAACLEDSLDGAEWQEKITIAERIVAERVRQKAVQHDKFRIWAGSCEERAGGTSHERALAWRTLEILMERELNKPQAAFAFELQVQEMDDKIDASVRQAAELFLSNEFKLPYYFGPSTLAKLSSANIQQFLALSAQQFEDVISSLLVSPSQTLQLPAKRQEALFENASKAMWEDIPRRATNGSSVKLLLESIGSFSRWYTNRPTAPNDPGVNGIAISMVDRARLLDAEWLRHHPEHQQLAEVLASALAHNYLNAEPNYKCKGQMWLVMNLNRLLCVHYRLPLGYGKFKEQKLDQLVKWMKRGFEANPQETQLI
jgi:hypothetical protein